MARNPIRPPGDDLAVRFAEIERRLRALESATPGGFTGDGTKTFLRSGRDLEVTGGDIIIDGGQLVAGPTTVDASGVGIGPTTLNASGVSVGPTTLNSSGLTVGSDVEIDATGLWVLGGLVTPLWTFTDQAATQNASLTTTNQNIHSVVVAPPSWVQTLIVVATHFAQFSSDASHNIQSRIRVGSDTTPLASMIFRASYGGADATQAASRTIPLEFSGSTAQTIRQNVNMSSGSNSANNLDLTVVAFGTRS